MCSKAENLEENSPYREKFKKMLKECVKNRGLQQTMPEVKPGQQQSNSDLENVYYARQSNGGDADRVLNSTVCPAHADYERPYNDNCRFKHMPSSSKFMTSDLGPNVCASSGKYQTSGFRDYSGDYAFPGDNDSTLRGLVGHNSEDSVKSQKSSKTVLSCKSSHNIKKLVKSQCKIYKIIGETLREMCNEESPDINNAYGVQGLTNTLPLTSNQCKRCCERLNSNTSQKDITTEILKGNSLDRGNTNTLAISVDDVINTRVINPIINKLHRMHLNNLKEEMSLMEDLEQLPSKVNEVYKSVIHKQQKY